jgi:hypothetical protein
MAEASLGRDEITDNLKRSNDEQQVIAALLQLSLEDVPIEELLQQP